MRGNLPTYEMSAPKTLAEALQILSDEPGVWRPFAGGTDLMVLLESGKLDHRKFISISQLGELRGVADGVNEVDIGALTTFSQLRGAPLVAQYFPLLVQAAAQVGAVAIQNRATLGGNIMNASPAGDSLPVLLAYDADVELVSAGGRRWMRYADFHTGYKKMAALPHEVLARVRLPKTAPWTQQYFRKVGARAAQAISKLCMAGLLRMEGEQVADCRIALGSVAPTPLRCVKTEAALKGQTLTPQLVAQAQGVLAAEIAPIDDIRSTADYRRRVAQNLLSEFLSSQ